jgi:eukaryotic-like serine/threonine-protein kinase
VDFGVATPSDMALAGKDIFVGTPAYMAPEQARGNAIVDARSDLYSLGATLFELLTGRPPHIGSTSIATIARLATTPAPRLSELLLEVPERLEELVARLLMSEPEHRPVSAREVALEFDALTRDASVPEQAKPLAMSTEPPPIVAMRLATTIVALQVGTKEQRRQLVDRLRAHGADTLPLGADSIVAHLGVKQAHGDEATRALDSPRGACVSTRFVLRVMSSTEQARWRVRRAKATCFLTPRPKSSLEDVFTSRRCPTEMCGSAHPSKHLRKRCNSSGARPSCSMLWPRTNAALTI